MAQRPYQLIKDGQVVFLDISTSMTLLAGLLNKESVYSHSLDNAIGSVAIPRLTFIFLGGKFYTKNRF